jgi:hypothetical protein
MLMYPHIPIVQVAIDLIGVLLFEEYGGLWLIRCHQRPETNISNCENWRKLTFDGSREYICQH